MRSGPEQTADEDQVEDESDGLSPEAYLLMLVGIVAWYFAVRYTGDHYGWYWSWLIVGGTFGIPLLLGYVANKPRRQREAAKRRELAEIEHEIAESGYSTDLLQRRLEVEERYRQLDKEDSKAEEPRGWRNKRISWPRRIVRWLAVGLLVVIMVPLGIAFYGAMFLLPSGAVFAGFYFVIGQWAWIPAVLTLPVGGWLVWWWVNRVPASTAQVAGMAGAAGA